MNKAAANLGMSKTNFTNTHGLTHDDQHLTTARDLAKSVARSNETARVSQNGPRPVQRGCTVQSESGYSRNVLWKNTNRLLKIQGFDGVKTGTTSAAGACLVSRGQRLRAHAPIGCAGICFIGCSLR